MSSLNKVLIIEPDVVLSDLYRQILVDANYEVIVSRGAQDAIHLADTHKPNIVILELQLAGHNGIEFLYEFRSYPEWQSVPVILLSSIPPAQLSAQVLWQQLGIAAYYYKPKAKLDALVRLVHNVLSAVIV